MPDPIEVNYVPDGDDWQVTVSGRGQQLTGRAPGLIAARDRADQLVEKIAPEQKFRTVVHLLDGDALAFTTAYLTARLSKPATGQPATAPAPAPDVKPAPDAPRADPRGAGEKPGAAPVQPPAPRPDSDQATPAGAKHGAAGRD
ncbi:MAG TPA: hypothetical protein VGP26_12385 [Actinophytocola sp.]|jgi:hypothetical protein|nr:hypothetical protein [Actinophytocola sp.]